MSRLSQIAWTALTLWGGMAVTSTSLAQPPVRQERREEKREIRQPAVERQERREERREPRRAKQILGSKLSIRGGESIGTVDDILFSDDGMIDELVVLNDGKYVLVPWEAAKFDVGRRVATVEIERERFREVPTFTAERWPDVYDVKYRERIYGYYGLRPRAERRIERREGPRR